MSPGLQLTRLRVAELRQFAAPLVVAELAPGLNILSGPNEAGKSSLVRAIRAAFFERHRSTAVEDLRPWGDAAASPTVEIDFAWAGRSYQLSKSFLSKKRCSLRCGSQVWEGVDAEDHLAQLFGFQFAGKGASKQEHWGIPGLLWVEQGTGQELLAAQIHAREHLHDALSQAQQTTGQPAPAVGADLAATGGDELLASFRAQRAELLTATGKPRGELAEASARVAQLQAAWASAQATLAAQSQQVDQLAAWRQAHQADAEQRPWEALQAQLAQVQQRRTALADTEKQLAEDVLRQSQHTQQHRWRLEQLAAFQQQEAALAQRSQALADAQQLVQQASLSLQVARERQDLVREQAQQTREQLRQVRGADTQRSWLARRDQAQADGQRLAQARAQAEAAQARCQALQTQRPGLSWDERQLQRWRQQEAELARLRAQQAAVATRLDYRLDPGATMSWQAADALPDDTVLPSPLSGQGSLALAAATRLWLPGWGELLLSPGGQDLAQWVERSQRLTAQLQAELAAAGVPDLAAAEAAWRQDRDLHQQLQLAEQALRLVAPQGLEALQAQSTEAAARLQAAEAALAGLAPVAQVPSLAAAEPGPSLAAAEAADEAASQRLQQCQADMAAAQLQLASAEQARDAAQREHMAHQALLQDPDWLARRAQAQADLLGLQAELEALAARILQTQASLASARPELLAQDAERLTRSIDQLIQAHRQRHEAMLLLERDLAHAGAQGLDEQAQLLAGELARAQSREQQLLRRARALDLLVRRLEAMRQASLTRLQAPLQKHLDRYVSLLLPGAQLSVDEQLAPGLLRRPMPSQPGREEQGPFEALSFGSREQLGLISRFAYADLLREAGRPTLLILDDALLHSDETRLAQMKRLVFDVAQRHQVLLLTCRPSAWRDMGVPLRDLPTLRQQGLARE